MTLARPIQKLPPCVTTQHVRGRRFVHELPGDFPSLGCDELPGAQQAAFLDFGPDLTYSPSHRSPRASRSTPFL